MESSLKPVDNFHVDPSAPGENEYPSGFPQSICDDVPQQKYLCSNCNNVLNEARQTLCGHRYCLACVNWLVRNNNNLVCKKCKEEDPGLESESSILTSENAEYTDEELQLMEEMCSVRDVAGSSGYESRSYQLFSDAAINKEILELKVHCGNQGCSWRSILKDFEEHQVQCEYALIPCNIGCGQMVLRRALACHLENACPNNMSVCPACCRSMGPSELQKHSCQILRGTKETKTDKKLKGTTEKVRAHENSSHVGHLQLLLHTATTNNSGLQASPWATPASAKETRAMDEQLPQVREAMSGLMLHWDVGQSEGELETDGGECSAAHSLRGEDQRTTLLDLEQQIDTLQQRVQISENIISVLNREVEKTQLGVETLERENQSCQYMIDQLEVKVLEQQQRLARKDLVISSLQQSLSAHQDVSYDGTFIWRLSNISSKIKEAISGHGNKPNLYSPAFYTSRYGFKVCMRLYLNGDGLGKGTHISLFFVIMKGEYDSLLSWPFKHKVTFFLLDQNHREHVIDAFRPDLTSSSFQRPVLDMNVASGCPLFFPLGKLHSPKHAYCKDDTIFIKCVVDTSS